MSYHRSALPWLAVIAGSIVIANGSDHLTGRRVHEVRISLEPWEGHEEPVTVTCDAPDRIEALIHLLRAALPSRDHKCRSVGLLELRFEDGGTRRMGLLPGHDANHYQLRVYSENGYYEVLQVPRGPFLATMEQLGVPVSEAGFPR